MTLGECAEYEEQSELAPHDHDFSPAEALSSTTREGHTDPPLAPDESADERSRHRTSYRAHGDVPTAAPLHGASVALLFGLVADRESEQETNGHPDDQSPEGAASARSTMTDLQRRDTSRMYRDRGTVGGCEEQSIRRREEQCADEVMLHFTGGIDANSLPGAEAEDR
jgi:hypothetical protein